MKVCVYVCGCGCACVPPYPAGHLTGKVRVGPKVQSAMRRVEAGSSLARNSYQLVQPCVVL